MAKLKHERRGLTAGPARWLFLLPALLLLLTIGVGDALADAALSEDFTTAWRDFHAMLKDPGKAKYRSSWKGLETRFLSVYTSDPKGGYGPKALYYVGRVNEELGKRSFNSLDFKTAVDYYQRVVSRFPVHTWADDALYLKAGVELNNLDNPAQAACDLRKILSDYPGSDNADKARALLAEIQPGVFQTMDEPARPEPQAFTPERKSEGAAANGFNRLNEVRSQSSDTYTRIVLDVDREIPFRHKALGPDIKRNKPHRLYIDLENTVLGHMVKPEVTIADGILRRVRTGLNRPGVARVVLDFHDLQKYQIFALENPFRIVIDVSAPEKSIRAQRAKPSPPNRPTPPASAKNEKRPKLKPAAAIKPAPKTAKTELPSIKPKPAEEIKSDYKLSPGGKKQAGDLVEQLGLTVKTIMIDPGHGGKDPGARANGLSEKDINLRFGRYLGQCLKGMGFEVLYTRTKDVFIPLEERTAMANVKKADLFISIHCNAYSSSKVHGLETYYLDLAKSKDAVRVAARENSVTAKKISDLQFILTDLMLNSKMKESKDLAKNVQSRIVSTLKSKYKIRDHGVHTAPFYVLMGAKMPSILVELGYITNSAEAKRLNSDKYLKAKAKGLANGVAAYKNQIERFASR